MFRNILDAGYAIHAWCDCDLPGKDWSCFLLDRLTRHSRVRKSLIGRIPAIIQKISLGKSGNEILNRNLVDLPAAHLMLPSSK